MNENALVDEIRRLGPWFHNIELPDGTRTFHESPLGDFPRYKWEEIADLLPADLSGWHCLDIGCNAGYYSVQLAQRGATVLGIDHDEHYLAHARFVIEQFGLSESIELRKAEVYEVDQLDGPFDLVLFMGVLYHLRYPLYALDKVAAQTRRLMVFQTLTMPGPPEADSPVVPEDVGLNDRDHMLDPGYPKMAFIEHKLACDPTNWWAPNPACCEAMLRSAGLRVAQRAGGETFLCEKVEEQR